MAKKPNLEHFLNGSLKNKSSLAKVLSAGGFFESSWHAEVGAIFRPLVGVAYDECAVGLEQV